MSYFLLKYVFIFQKQIYMGVKSLQLCLILCDPMDCSSPGSPVHGILQARILDLVLLQGTFPAQGWNLYLMSPALAGGFFTASATWEAPNTELFIAK